MEIPSTKEEWLDKVFDGNLANESIHNLGRYQSASEITENQFLLLRVIRTLKSQQVFSDNFRDWIDTNHYTRAKKCLENFPSWIKYQKSFSQQVRSLGPGNFPDLGTFSLVSYYHCAVDRTKDNEQVSPKFSPVSSRTRAMLASRSEDPPSPIRGPTNPIPKLADIDFDSSPDQHRTPNRRLFTQPSSGIHKPYYPASAVDSTQYPATEDEQIVNAALVLFLNTITMHFEVDSDWTLHRKPFKLGVDGGKLFEARVDGYLRSRESDQITAILEVKPAIRAKQPLKIRMQESAQMAAWISNYPGDYESYRKSKKLMRRLIISQDRHEIYLTFATYDAAYVDHMTGRVKDPSADTLMVMNEFGPFVISKEKHMTSLAKYVLAFCLEQCTQVRGEQAWMHASRYEV